MSLWRHPNSSRRIRSRRAPVDVAPFRRRRLRFRAAVRLKHPNPSRLLSFGCGLTDYNSASVSVILVSGAFAGTVLATLTSNGLNRPQQASFDGERILVTNNDGNSV